MSDNRTNPVQSFKRYFSHIRKDTIFVLYVLFSFSSRKYILLILEKHGDYHYTPSVPIWDKNPITHACNLKGEKEIIFAKFVHKNPFLNLCLKLVTSIYIIPCGVSKHVHLCDIMLRISAHEVTSPLLLSFPALWSTGFALILSILSFQQQRTIL